MQEGIQESMHGEYERIEKLLRSTIERERLRRVGVTASIQKLVPALEQRLCKRLIDGASNTDKRAKGASEVRKEPMDYMRLCRTYLAKLDTQGWSRSYHQCLFHDDFLKECMRSFWNLEPPGQFAYDHQRVLRVNSWDHIT